MGTAVKTWEPDAALQSLIRQAREERKWLHCSYQDLWFSPTELEREWANGRFRWGAVNWTLRDPKILIEQSNADATNAIAYRDRILARITKELELD